MHIVTMTESDFVCSCGEHGEDFPDDKVLENAAFLHASQNRPSTLLMPSINFSASWR